MVIFQNASCQLCFRFIDLFLKCGYIFVYGDPGYNDIFQYAMLLLRVESEWVALSTLFVLQVLRRLHYHVFLLHQHSSLIQSFRYFSGFSLYPSVPFLSLSAISKSIFSLFFFVFVCVCVRFVCVFFCLFVVVLLLLLLLLFLVCSSFPPSPLPSSSSSSSQFFFFVFCSVVSLSCSKGLRLLVLLQIIRMFSLFFLFLF